MNTLEMRKDHCAKWRPVIVINGAPCPGAGATAEPHANPWGLCAELHASGRSFRSWQSGSSACFRLRCSFETGMWFALTPRAA